MAIDQRFRVISLGFTDEEKERIRIACGIVPIRRQLKKIILDWADEAIETIEADSGDS